MKKIIQILMICLILFSCTDKKDPLDRKPLTKQYIESMEDYEFMEVSLLGCLYENDKLEDILNRAKDKLNLSFIDEIDDDHIIYGDQSLRMNYVYLITPKNNVNITVGSYDASTNDISKVHYSSKNSLPFIYIESGEVSNPVGMIKYDIEQEENSAYYMYTGLDIMNNRLRTQYRMGLVDMSDYLMFDQGELPFYSQFVFDVLQSMPEVAYEIAQGNYLSYMDEAMIEENMYSVFSLASNNKLYAINYSSERNDFKYLISDDGTNWYDPSNAKG